MKQLVTLSDLVTYHRKKLRGGFFSQMFDVGIHNIFLKFRWKMGHMFNWVQWNFPYHVRASGLKKFTSPTTRVFFAPQKTNKPASEMTTSNSLLRAVPFEIRLREEASKGDHKAAMDAPRSWKKRSVFFLGGGKSKIPISGSWGCDLGESVSWCQLGRAIKFWRACGGLRQGWIIETFHLKLHSKGFSPPFEAAAIAAARALLELVPFKDPSGGKLSFSGRFGWRFGWRSWTMEKCPTNPLAVGESNVGCKGFLCW